MFVDPLISLPYTEHVGDAETQQSSRNGALAAKPEVVFITSYPPRECGIATYSFDLLQALDRAFDSSFTMRICPLESDDEQHEYPHYVEHVLNTNHLEDFADVAKSINDNANVRLVMIQHEFGFFAQTEDAFRRFMATITKPIVIVFHTVLPYPNEALRSNVQFIAAAADSCIVMTKSSETVLIRDYGVPSDLISVIAHGTHLVPHLDRGQLKLKYDVAGRTVLSTFGLLGSGKSIETTLVALPGIIRSNPDALFLIIGKTHPSVMKREGELYREKLCAMVADLQLENHVRFINQFLPLPDLLEYLQLTDVYLFTSNDPNQAVSGTFSYAISCGCPVVSTPIPHAREVLRSDAGISIDFGNSEQLCAAVNELLRDDDLRTRISSNALHRMASTAWENSAIAHAKLFEQTGDKPLSLRFNLPAINLDHIKKLTTDFGMIQFSKINQPDISSGYTLDDNARALVAMCQHYELTRDDADIDYIKIYLNFIKHCLQSDGSFMNYVDEQKKFTEQNAESNLADANGRALWALGYLISMTDLLPFEHHMIGIDADLTMQSALTSVTGMHSTRAMAFAIKGLYYRNTRIVSATDQACIHELAKRMVQMYRHESKATWQWYESYLTYANSILPEAMLCAYLATGDNEYREIAKSTFDFLLSKTFRDESIKVVPNTSWMNRGDSPAAESSGGEQPIDVAYTILALSKFHREFNDESYHDKMETSFSWFVGNNHLHQVIYNPCTGGCYDGLEDEYVNLNQGAESTVSYLMARLTMEKVIGNR